jgi:hypothetical protein
MATTKAPLFGLDASGSLGGAIVFSKWRGRTYVRAHAVPSNPSSGLQVGMRSSMKFMTQSWAAMSQVNKDSWNDLAAPDNITQLNAMVRYGQQNVRRNLGVVLNPTAAAGVTPTAPATPATVAQPKTLVLSWTQPVVTPGNYATYIYGSLTLGFTADVSNLIAVIEHGQLSYTWIGLATGVLHYWRVRQSNTDGELGALTAEQSGTPT